MMIRRGLFLGCKRTLRLSLNNQARATSIPGVQRRPASAAAAAVQEARAERLSENQLKPFSEIPGPKPLPVLRNLLDFRRNSKKLNQFLGECYEKYGEIFKLEAPGNNNFVYMANPNLLENILRAEGKYPRRDVSMSPKVEWLLTDLGYPVSMAFQSGEDWKKGRSAINKQIKPSNVQSYTTGLNGVATRFTNYLKSVRDEDERIGDISMPLRRLLVEMSAKFVYNADIDALDNPTDETKRFIEGVTLVFDCLGKLIVEPPLYKLYPNKLYRDFKKGFGLLKEYGLKHAEIARKKIETGEESEVQGLLEQWLREGRMSEAEALMISADMFGAGVDTTSNQAAFLLHCMAKNPEAQEKLYEEIQSVLGDRTVPTPEDISKMPYLKGCMQEAFRMRSTVESSARVLAEDISLMGYHIPADTNVWYLAFIPAKDERIFPNPEKFDPARWARDRPNPFATLPFGFGPRSCYGKRFAELELKLILLQMTREFVLDTDLEKIEVEHAAVIRPAGDLPLYLKDRN